MLAGVEEPTKATHPSSVNAKVMTSAGPGASTLVPDRY
jgi:hypothetical protein